MKKHKKTWKTQENIRKLENGVYFKKTWSAETLQPGLEYDNFKPRLKSRIFKGISFLNA